MTLERNICEEAIRRSAEIQRQAADPARSAIVRAAAGSGKTKVLIDRFVRLCLSGSPVKSILAVTFTNRAAVEIKERLLDVTRSYALLPADPLREKLRELLGREPVPQETARAGTLHEELLEDLTGLEVGTIHAFCQVVLGRTASIVGLDPRLQILEREDDLWDEALDLLEREVAEDPAARAELIALAAAPDQARRVLARLRHDRVHLERWLDAVWRRAGGPDPEGVPLSLPRRAPLLPALLHDLRGVLFAGGSLAGRDEPSPLDLVPDLVAAARALAAGLADAVLGPEESPTEALIGQVQDMAAASAAAADAFAAAREEADVDAALDALRTALLTREGRLRTLRGRKDGKDRRRLALERTAAPLLQLDAAARLVALYRHNRRLLHLGLRALDLYDELKRRDRVLDFQDLERLAWTLLRGEQALWIQYRFDEALDHLLVDEFQDTNRNQWEILRPFAEEFVAGESARGAGRTVFLVGDVKQSIYGFRGAEPEIFGEAAAWLSRQAGAPVLTLPTNFRSRSGVVEAVGRLFNRAPLAGLLPPGEAEAARQACARAGSPGRVVIVPPMPAAEDGLGADHLAARAAARLVRRLVDGDGTGAERRAYRDILLLCRNRTHIAAYEEALREAGIPFVPAGRGMLARSREVRDVLALLRWLVYPADSTALASVLRSPLFRVAERTLQAALAGAGGRSLWSVLEREREALGLDAEVELLRSWRGRLAFESCHDLLRRIYREGSVLERFEAALGEQARYNLLRLHDLALSPELGALPTMRELATLIRRAAELGAEEEAALPERDSGRVRLMTVHGAKGLEAPVVLLVDADAAPVERLSRLQLGDGDGPLLYDPGPALQSAGARAGDAGDATAAGSAGSPLAAAVAAAAARARREEADILYVAMTRARDELYVLGGEQERKGERESMLDWLAAAVSSEGGGEDGALPITLGAPDWCRTEEAVAPSPRPVRTDVVPDAAAGDQGRAGGGPPLRIWRPPILRPRFVMARPPSAADGEPSPSALVPEVADDAWTREQAIDHGEEVHLWLQLAGEGGVTPPGEGVAWQEAHDVLANPALAWCLRPGGAEARILCEVPFLRREPGAGVDEEQRAQGVIDWLLLRPGRADVIDFKTTRRAEDPAAREAIVAEHRPQLEAYRDVVRALHPDREVGAHILLTAPWTEEGRGVLVTL